MSRTTIDYGIDLGTTNSGVALMNGTGAEVIRGNEGQETTPSAVWIDKRDRLYVGRAAYERLEDDPGNAFAEFKLFMGQNKELEAARNQRKFRPEELSAEVLKVLRSDVARRKSEEIRAAVITVPAAFEAPQCQATNQAARLAGLVQSPLLQEPVAAAMAYGFESTANKAFWLVYDFGGGTFDAAVCQIRDGEIRVVNHGGDNHLGGKLVDWAIVEQLLTPALLKEHKLGDFRRGNAKWRGAFAKLKIHAEQAKIRLSQSETATVMIDFLCNDDKGEPVSFEHELRRAEIEAIMEPFVRRSIHICRQVLTEKRLAAADVEKVLLVGGPTMSPYLRARLLDATEGLGIALDYSVDPMTVVARGAAVFAATQRLSSEARGVVAAGKVALELDYPPVGSDEEVMVGGRANLEGPAAGCTIEFIRTGSLPWRSGRVSLSAEGMFLASLRAGKEGEHVYTIELRDAQGTALPTEPDRLSYKVGLTIKNPPLIHSLGVALASNEMLPFVMKGVALPTHRRLTLKTAFDARRGQQGTLIRIPVVEGEVMSRANRNRLVGQIEIAGSNLRRDVPAGSDVEVTLAVDESRLVTARAYVPVLDEEFEQVVTLEMKVAGPDELRKQLTEEKKRLGEIREKAKQTASPAAASSLARVEQERMLEQVDAALGAVNDDPDAAAVAESRLLDLQRTLDEAEAAVEWPALVQEATQTRDQCREVVNQFGKQSDKERLALLDREAQSAMESKDADLLRRKVEDLNTHRLLVLKEQPGWWVGIFEVMKSLKSDMRDQSAASRAIQAGTQAIARNDVAGLRDAVSTLAGLLPEAVRQEKGFGSTVSL